jgi:ATP phosphoribosyltransferase
MAEMNVPRSVLQIVCQMLPADVSPTILPEQKPEWVVVKVLVSSKILTNLKGDLKRL